MVHRSGLPDPRPSDCAKEHTRADDPRSHRRRCSWTTRKCGKLRIWVRRPKRAPFLDLLGASQLDNGQTEDEVAATVWSVTGLDSVERDADDGAMVRGDVHGQAEVEPACVCIRSRMTAPVVE